ncbi:FecR domain-containing protein [Sorangium sp. So ce233]|uniref:FecR domain-containing protein n=1 Tax=Sorangium sp. So ce233 TaxID=3133290 RepID=UPI003F616E48
MTAPVCPKAALVEALHSGRLGAREAAVVEHHLGVCAGCAALARDLDRIGAALRAPRAPATPLEHQRARLTLLRRATEPQAPRAPLRRTRLALAGVALALAGVAVWVGALAARSPEGRAALALRHRLPPRLPAGRDTTLRPSDDARFERERSAGLDVVTLLHGALDVTVRPLAAGERFLVRTTDAEIEVRGTAFRVEAERGEIREVAVTEGTVEVRYAGFSAVIPSGGSWRATGAAEAADSPGGGLPPPSSSGGASSPGAGGASSPGAGGASSPGTGAGSSPGAAAAAGLPAQITAVERRAPPGAPSASSARSAPGVAPSSSPAAREFAEAMQALGRGDYAGGAAKFEAFSSAHPGDARADEADYLRAIALQRAGRAAEAAAAARRYLAARPNGAHRAEAKRIIGN